MLETIGRIIVYCQASHRDALFAEYTRDHADQDASEERAPLPTTGAAFLRLIDAGWDAEAERRPQGQHTTVVVHLDAKQRLAALHLGPLLSEVDRRYLTCDATGEVWFERDGTVIGSGRSTRTISRRLRRALEHRHPTSGVPGCGATRGLHAHHIRHWEDGGETQLDNLVLLCPTAAEPRCHGIGWAATTFIRGMPAASMIGASAPGLRSP